MSRAPGKTRTADRAGSGGGPGRLFGTVWLWPALAAFVLGLYQLDRPALWRDEIATWSIATRPVPGLLATMRHTDAAQVAYYLFMHYWLALLGTSAVALRLPSVLAMAGAAGCVALLGARLSGRRAGLVSGLVFAVLPSVSRFAQEARSYALMVLAATLAAVLLLRALDAPGWRRWTAYGLCVAATGYLNLVALAMLAGHAAVVALDGRVPARRGVRVPRVAGFAVAAAAGTAVTIPVMLPGLRQAGGQISWIKRPGIGYYFSAFGTNLFYSAGVAAGVLVLAVLAWASSAQFQRAIAMATALALLPVGAVWLISQSGVSYFDPRYLLFILAAFAVLAGSAVAAHGTPMTAALLIVLALLSAGDQRAIRLPIAHDWPSYPSRTTGFSVSYTGAAWLIAAHARAGDGIAYQGWPDNWQMVAPGVRYYLTQYLHDAARMPRTIFVAATAAQADGLHPVPCRRPAACIGAEARVWVVGIGRAADPYRLLPAAEAAVLRARYEVREIAHADGLTVALLDP
jgi:mannosyltransferase